MEFKEGMKEYLKLTDNKAKDLTDINKLTDQKHEIDSKSLKSGL